MFELPVFEKIIVSCMRILYCLMCTLYCPVYTFDILPCVGSYYIVLCINLAFFAVIT